MLRKNPGSRAGTRGGRFAIVASLYNSPYVDAMVRAALRELKRARATVKTVRVPGAYEIPVVAARLARTGQFAGVLCLGVILRGETTHAAHIGDAVTRALMEIQLETEVPVIHEVLLLENREQAEVRCRSRRHNRGQEAAQTALAMAGVLAQFSGKKV
jgi:6,7-dimethyl-8-ribityllumazine synthase